jgi:hypothetical protein
LVYSCYLVVTWLLTEGVRAPKNQVGREKWK